MKINSLFLAIFLTSLFNVGCGGGKDNPSKENNGSTASTKSSIVTSANSSSISNASNSTASLSSDFQSLIKVEVFPLIDAEFSNEAIQRVKFFSSGIDINENDSPLIVGNPGIQAFTILALNENDDMLLAGFSSESEVTLTSESTAFFLVNLLMGPAESATNFNNRNLLIRSTHGFESLTTAIQVAFEKGIPLSADEGVLSATTLVLGQVDNNSNIEARQGRFEKVSEVGRSNGSLPVILLDDSLSIFNLSIELTYADESNLTLMNNGLLYWSAKVKDVNGSQYAHQLLRPGKESFIQKSVPGAFSVAVDSSQRSHAYNTVDISFDVIKLVLGEFENKYSENECLDVAADKVIGANMDLFSAAIRTENFSLIDEVDFWLDSAELASKCGSAYLSGFKTNTLKQSIKYMNAALKINKIGKLGVKLHQYKKSLDFTPKDVGVCVDDSETPMSCIAKMKLHDSNNRYTYSLGDDTQVIFIVPGASINLVLESWDIEGKRTAIPYGLRFEQISATGGLVFDKEAMLLKGTSDTGSLTIQVTDPATDVSTSLQVGAAQIQLSPVTVETVVGETFALELTANVLSNPIIATEGTSVKLIIEDQSQNIVTVNSIYAFWAWLTGSQNIGLIANKEGDASGYLEVSSPLGIFRSNKINIKVKPDDEETNNEDVSEEEIVIYKFMTYTFVAPLLLSNNDKSYSENEVIRERVYAKDAEGNSIFEPEHPTAIDRYVTEVKTSESTDNDPRNINPTTLFIGDEFSLPNAKNYYDTFYVCKIHGKWTKREFNWVLNPTHSVTGLWEDFKWDTRGVCDNPYQWMPYNTRLKLKGSILYADYVELKNSDPMLVSYAEQSSGVTKVDENGILSMKIDLKASASSNCVFPFGETSSRFYEITTTATHTFNLNTYAGSFNAHVTEKDDFVSNYRNGLSLLEFSINSQGSYGESWAEKDTVELWPQVTRTVIPAGELIPAYCKM